MPCIRVPAQHLDEPRRSEAYALDDCLHPSRAPGPGATGIPAADRPLRLSGPEIRIEARHERVGRENVVEQLAPMSGLRWITWLAVKRSCWSSARCESDEDEVRAHDAPPAQQLRQHEHGDGDAPDPAAARDDEQIEVAAASRFRCAMLPDSATMRVYGTAHTQPEQRRCWSRNARLRASRATALDEQSARPAGKKNPSR